MDKDSILTLPFIAGEIKVLSTKLKCECVWVGLLGVQHAMLSKILFEVLSLCSAWLLNLKVEQSTLMLGLGLHESLLGAV